METKEESEGHEEGLEKNLPVEINNVATSPRDGGGHGEESSRTQTGERKRV